MTEKPTSGVISRRRMLSLLGLAAIVVPAMGLTVSDAEAQQTSAQTGTPAAPQTGTERRQERRTGRVRRRVARRKARRKGRAERRQLRRGGTQQGM